MESVLLLIIGGVIALALYLMTGRAANGRGANQSSNSLADPLAEAEVLLVYGRKKQAMALLEKALQSHPARADIAAKLQELTR